MENRPKVIESTAQTIVDRGSTLVKLNQILEVNSLVTTLENWLHTSEKEIKLLNEQVSFTLKVIDESNK
jgi:hypothetical protein